MPLQQRALDGREPHAAVELDDQVRMQVLLATSFWLVVFEEASREHRARYRGCWLSAAGAARVCPERVPGSVGEGVKDLLPRLGPHRRAPTCPARTVVFS